MLRARQAPLAHVALAAVTMFTSSRHPPVDGHNARYSLSSVMPNPASLHINAQAPEAKHANAMSGIKSFGESPVGHRPVTKRKADAA